MKRKVFLLVVIILIITGCGKKEEDKVKLNSLKEEVMYNKKIEDDSYYKKISGDVINEDTLFSEMAFITGHEAYIFDPSSLREGNFKYKKVFDIPEQVSVLSMDIPYGADISFYSDNNKKYTFRDSNYDRNVENTYAYYDNAIYSSSDYVVKDYSDYFKVPISYDLMGNLFYAKDNVLYKKNYGYYDFIKKINIDDSISKIDGNYEGEKILKIYNQRIVKTDKAFYEVVEYYKDGVLSTTTLKMNLLSKYYDEVLTLTYEYVILKDYTIIPINDTLVNNHGKEYNANFYLKKYENDLDTFEE